MDIKRLSPGPRISGAVVHDGTVYVAGTVASDPSADVKGQTQQILKRIDDLLAAAGTDKSKILSATVWLANMGSYAEMNAAWDAWLDKANPPARATVESRLASPQYLVEMACIAAR
jgi:enamine deaminase RidA (YjgF/YER057c/UK114 family)